MNYIDIFPNYGKRAKEVKGLRKYFLKIFPLHTLSIIRFELHLLLVRVFSSKNTISNISAPRNEKGEVLVNIGSGSIGLLDWINIDAFKLKNVTRLCDIRKNLPIDDNVANGIFCEHVFEHLDYTEEALMFLSECRRVMKPSGVLRIIVPDAEKYLKAYVAGGWQQLAEIRPLIEEKTDFHYKCKYNTPMELINVVFRQGGEHKFAYDFSTLEFLLKTVGFSKVYKKTFGDSEMANLCIDQKYRESESLYVEAIK